MSAPDVSLPSAGASARPAAMLIGNFLSGGLRTHGARVITYASSRKGLTHRHIPATTEIYLARRFFPSRQVREMLWLQTAATLAFKGAPLRSTLKALVGAALFPDNLRQVRRRVRAAGVLLDSGPRIPSFAPAPPASSAARRPS